MGGVLKRYWWVINLVVLAVLAFLAAKIANNVVAAEIAALKTHPRESKEEPKKAQSASNIAQKLQQSIVDRNLFNSDPPNEDAVKSNAGDEDKGPKGAIPGPYDECADSRLPYTLVATWIASPAEESVAIFRINNYGQLVRWGETLDGAKVAAIYRERAVFLNGQSYECVTLGVAQKGGSAPKPASKPASDGKPAEKTPSNSEAVIRAGIREISENRKEVDRAMLDEQLADLNKLSKDARVTAYYKDGKQAGFKVTRVNQGSLYDVLGLKRNDILTGVNGEDLDSPTKALKLIEGLSSAKDITITIERRGKPMEVEFNIR